MNALIDTHTHLYTEEFDADRELAVIRAVEAGVTRLFMPNIDDTTVEAMLKLCEAHDCCYPMIGFHPTSVDAGWKERLEKVKGYLTSSSHRFYGIGEVGIDLYWDKTFREEQMIVFEEQVKWALEQVKKGTGIRPASDYTLPGSLSGTAGGVVGLQAYSLARNLPQFHGC